MPLEDKVLSIHSLKDLYRCLNLASLLELSGWPKPGNIHRTQNFESTRFEHFLAAIAAIQPNFRDFCERVYNDYKKSEENYSFVNLGTFFKEAAEEMMKWQSGGNVILGHILILAPIAAAAAICLKLNGTTFSNFKAILEKVINNASVQDTINLYEAIRISNPGGLGTVEKYDINDENSFKQIQLDEISLKKIFELSKEYDLISNEYSTGFNIILNEGLPFYLEEFNQTKDINITTVNTFLKILSAHPDSLVIRKAGKEAAAELLKKAQEILDQGGISTNEGLNLINALDTQLQKEQGIMNPGTTADLIAGIIFCALVFGVRF